LMTNSNFVGCSTGKSAGLAPFKILSIMNASRLLDHLVRPRYHIGRNRQADLLHWSTIAI
jgi:hypothetical protein